MLPVEFFIPSPVNSVPFGALYIPSEKVRPLLMSGRLGQKFAELITLRTGEGGFAFNDLDMMHGQGVYVEKVTFRVDRESIQACSGDGDESLPLGTLLIKDRAGAVLCVSREGNRHAITVWGESPNWATAPVSFTRWDLGISLPDGSFEELYSHVGS